MKHQAADVVWAIAHGGDALVTDPIYREDPMGSTGLLPVILACQTESAQCRS